MAAESSLLSIARYENLLSSYYIISIIMAYRGTKADQKVTVRIKNANIGIF